MLRLEPQTRRLRRAIVAISVVVCALVVPRVVLAATTLSCAEPNEAAYASLLDGDAAWRTDDARADDAPDGIDVAGAPMSLSEGASAVAPHPIDGPSDARIEAVKRCQEQVTADEITAPTDDAPMHQPAEVMPATLPSSPTLPSSGPLDQPPSR
ncbi:MAG: hypothetical protein RIF41_40405 [Polyangiaceae bacterium]